MADVIVAKEPRFTKLKRGRIKLANKKRNFVMARCRLLDAVTAKQRLKTPFSFKWLKFKTCFFGLTLKKGAAI